MTAAKQLTKLKTTSLPQGDRMAWLASATDAIRFLLENAASSDILIYGSMPNVYIQAVLTPASNVTPPDVHDLLRGYIDQEDSWIVQKSYGGDEGHQIYLEPPMSSPGCDSLVGSEKLVFRRFFDGLTNFKRPIELSQKLIHALNLHFLDARNSYCRLNDEGDLEEIISIFEDDDGNPRDPITAVFIKQRDLFEFMALSGTVLFRDFDFTRTDPDSFDSWDHAERAVHKSPDLSFNSAKGTDKSFASGYHITRTSLTVDAMVEEWKASLDKSNRRYEIFKIHDFKNKQFVECSASPNSIANYFTASDKPFETSPVFFKSEVLQKYKADPDKYRIEHRSISCRNAWSLKTYDINEEGQVHTYIVYLSSLPYSEQQYWKSFNEWPKGPISARAMQTDFEGNFSTQPDPLAHLEHAIEHLEREGPAWWMARHGTSLPKVLYPATTSSKEWADEILALDQLLVEGFSLKGLRTLAAKIPVVVEKEWASLKVVEECLVGVGIDPERAKELASPLRELHNLRSKVKGHATGEGKKLEESAQKAHGSLRAHFTDLAQRCADSFDVITTSLQNAAVRAT